MVTINIIWSFPALAVVSSQVLGGSDFLSSRSTTDKKSSDNQIVGQYPPPDVQQQPQQYYQQTQYYQPAVAEQRQPYQPEYYQQQQEQQYAQNFQPVGEKQVIFYKNLWNAWNFRSKRGDTPSGLYFGILYMEVDIFYIWD